MKFEWITKILQGIVELVEINKKIYYFVVRDKETVFATKWFPPVEC